MWEVSERLGAGCKWHEFGPRTWCVEYSRASGQLCLGHDLLAPTPQLSERASVAAARRADVQRAATQRGRSGASRSPAHVGAGPRRGRSSEHRPATGTPRSAQRLDCEGTFAHSRALQQPTLCSGPRTRHTPRGPCRGAALASAGMGSGALTSARCASVRGAAGAGLPQASGASSSPG